MNRIKLSREYIYEAYIVNEKPASQIAKECGVAMSTIYNRLREYDIPRSEPHTGMCGKHLSEEAKQKISAKLKGRKKGPFTLAHRRAISCALKGKKRGPLSEEHKQKLREAKQGFRHSEETKQKISKAQIGKIISKETRRKQSLARKGKKIGPHSLDRCRKISDGLRGRKLSISHKENISKALRGNKKCGWALGKHLTMEHRQKLSDGIRGKKHYNWQGGITKLTLSIRRSLKSREWKKAVLAQGNYQCEQCGQRGDVLHVDHYPKSFATIFHTNKIDSFEQAMSCDDFWDTSNGRVLCRECHENTETYKQPIQKHLIGA